MKVDLTKAVFVTWVDSATYREWYDFDEIKKLVLDKTLIVSVGYLVEQNKDWVVLAQNMDDKSCSGITKIPKSSIAKMKMLPEFVGALKEAERK